MEFQNFLFRWEVEKSHFYARTRPGSRPVAPWWHRWAGWEHLSTTSSPNERASRMVHKGVPSDPRRNGVAEGEIAKEEQMMRMYLFWVQPPARIATEVKCFVLRCGLPPSRASRNGFVCGHVAYMLQRPSYMGIRPSGLLSRETGGFGGYHCRFYRVHFESGKMILKQPK